MNRGDYVKGLEVVLKHEQFDSDLVKATDIYVYGDDDTSSPTKTEVKSEVFLNINISKASNTFDKTNLT